MTKLQATARRSSTSSQLPTAKASRPSSSYWERSRGRGEALADRVLPATDRGHSDATLLLRPAEVAETLGISRSKVFELLAKQELPSLHIGRSTRVPRPQLEKWIQAQVCWQPQAPSGLLGRLRTEAIARP